MPVANPLLGESGMRHAECLVQQISFKFLTLIVKLTLLIASLSDFASNTIVFTFMREGEI